MAQAVCNCRLAWQPAVNSAGDTGQHAGSGLVQVLLPASDECRAERFRPGFQELFGDQNKLAVIQQRQPGHQIGKWTVTEADIGPW